MATRKRTTKEPGSESSPGEPTPKRPRRSRAKSANSARSAAPKAPRARAKKAIESGAVASPQRQLDDAVLARRLIKDNPRALSVPEWAREEATLKKATKGGVLAQTAAKVINLGRGLIGLVRK